MDEFVMANEVLPCNDLYQPTAEELDALWETSNNRGTPCANPNCVPCGKLRVTRLEALYKIIEHAELHMARKLRTVTCTVCLNPCFVELAHLHQEKWIGPCCWDERLRMTE